jgi:8-hydroxy-5-deazaflavin:NADPH oxidoreductase
VIDTCNYYPDRDGAIAEIDAGLTDNQWVGKQLKRPVIKAFNSMMFVSLDN